MQILLISKIYTIIIPTNDPAKPNIALTLNLQITLITLVT